MRPSPIQLQRRVVFLHIAKTAGTSIVDFFARRLPPGALCSHGDFLQFPQEKEAFTSALASHQFISGHMGYAELAPLMPGAYSFTFLRDPVERVLSFYTFCLHEDMQRQFPVARAAAGLGLEGFLASRLPEVCEMLDNQQVWQLASGYWQSQRQAMAELSETELLAMARAHLDNFDHVGLTESFDADFRLILDALDIEEAVPQKRAFRTAHPVGREQLPPAALAALEDRLALDYALIEGVRKTRASAGK